MKMKKKLGLLEVLFDVGEVVIDLFFPDSKLLGKINSAHLTFAQQRDHLPANRFHSTPLCLSFLSLKPLGAFLYFSSPLKITLLPESKSKRF